LSLSRVVNKAVRNIANTGGGKTRGNTLDADMLNGLNGGDKVGLEWRDRNTGPSVQDEWYHIRSHGSDEALEGGLKRLKPDHLLFGLKRRN